VAKGFFDLGFRILATKGTAACLNGAGIPAEVTLKVSEGRPNIVDRIKNREVQMIVNTSLGRIPTEDAHLIRQSAIR
ncbi:hypothetical protein EO238_34845, partial [Citrobacter sp. AAK_AS5]